MDNALDQTAREPYEAPKVEDVPLRAEEQLLAGCKQIATGGPAAFSCVSCMAPTAS